MTTYSVLIEGNIASGKTTAIKILERNLKDKVKVFEEPYIHGPIIMEQIYSIKCTKIPPELHSLFKPLCNALWHKFNLKK
jgi:thymidylate kinase